MTPAGSPESRSGGGRAAWRLAAGNRVKLCYEERVVRHLNRECPDLEGQAVLRGRILALDGRGTATVLLDPPDLFWHLVVPLENLVPEARP